MKEQILQVLLASSYRLAVRVHGIMRNMGLCDLQRTIATSMPDEPDDISLALYQVVRITHGFYHELDELLGAVQEMQDAELAETEKNDEPN